MIPKLLNLVLIFSENGHKLTHVKLYDSQHTMVKTSRGCLLNVVSKWKDIVQENEITFLLSQH